MKNEALMTMDEREEYAEEMKQANRKLAAADLTGGGINLAVLMKSQEDEVYRQKLMSLLLHIIPKQSADSTALEQYKAKHGTWISPTMGVKVESE